MSLAKGDKFGDLQQSVDLLNETIDHVRYLCPTFIECWKMFAIAFKLPVNGALVESR